MLKESPGRKNLIRKGLRRHFGHWQAKAKLAAGGEEIRENRGKGENRLTIKKENLTVLLVRKVTLWG